MKRSFRHSYDQVYSACKQALKRLDLSIEYTDKASGVISASTSSTFLSWGETIDITIRRSNRNVVVEVESNSKAQLFSWGKNDRNEEEILDEIDELLG
jgi:hypothetical protein